MKDIEIDIGTEIRKRLHEQGLSVNWLAERIGADNSNLGKMLSNQRLSIKHLVRISIVLDKDFFEYFSKEITKMRGG